MRRKKILKWALRIALALAACMVLLLVSVFIVLRTDSGRNMLVDLVQDAASSPDMNIRINDLKGALPFNMQVGELTLADSQGVWLRVAGFDFDMSAWALLGGAIHVNRLVVGDVDFKRPPVSTQPAPEPEPSGPVSFAIPSIPPLVINELRVDNLQLQLSPDEQKRFRISGTCAPQDAHFGAALQVQELLQDGTPGPEALQLDARLNQADGHLALKLAFDEQPGGLVGKALQSTEPAHLLLQGDGPLQDWKGTLKFTSGSTDLLSSNLALGLSKAITFSLDGTLRPPKALVPPDVLPLLGESTDLSVNLALVDERMELRALHIKTKTTDISGKCTLGPAPEAKLDGSFTVAVTDTAPLKDLAQLELAAPATLNLQIAGSQEKPELTVALKADDLRQGDVKIASTTLEARVLTTEALSSNGGSFDINTRLRTKGTYLGDKPVGKGEIALDLNTLIEHNKRLKDLNLNLQIADAAIKADGQADLEDLSTDLNAQISIPDINGIIGGVSPVQGGVDIRCTAKGGPEQGIEARIKGAIDKLQGLPPDVAPLVGSRLDLNADTFFKDNHLDIKQFALSGKTSVTLAGSMRTDDQTADLKLTVTPPKDIDMEQAAGVVVKGMSPITAAVNGPLAAPKVRLDLAMQQLVANGNRIDHPTLKLDLEAPTPAPSPKLTPIRLDAKLSGQPLTLATECGLRQENDGSQTLMLRNLSFDAPGVQLQAGLELGLANQLAQGELTLKLKDLKKLGLIAGMDMNGTGSINAKPEIRSGKQAVNVQGALDAISVAGVSLKKLSLQLQSSDVMALDKASGKIHLSQLQSGDVAVDKADVTLSGTQNGAKCTVTAQGTADKPFSVSLTASAQQDKQAWDVILDALQAKYADFPVRLASQARVRIDGQDITISKPLTLKLADASFQASGALTSQKTDLSVDLKQFKLSSLSSIASMPVNGEVNLNTRLSGAPKNPTLNTRLDIKKLTPTDENYAKAPPMDIGGDIRISGQKLAADIDMLLNKKEVGKITAALPVTFATAPFAFEVKPNAKISSSIKLGMKLDPLTPLFMPPGQSLKSRLDVDMKVSGPLSAPQPDGTVRISKAMYENIETGTIINNLLVELRAKGMQMELSKFSANDGGNGKISGSGSVLIDADKGMPFDFKIDLDKFTGVRMDLATSQVSGSIEAKGSTQKAKVDGQLVVDNGVINIPAALPPGVTNIEVEEVNVPGQKKAEDVNVPESETDNVPMKLDITVRIPDHFFVRGQGLQSEWGGNLHIYGHANDPRIKGKLNVVRGHLDFLDWRFVLDKGKILFSGESPPSPYMEIITSAKLTDITAYINLDGSPTDLLFELSSEPSMPENEILARLIFKKSVQDLGPLDAIRLALVADSVAGGKSNLNGAVSGIQNVLGLDNLGLGTSSSGNTTLEAGTYISDRVYVKGQKGLTTKDDSVSVEVEVTPQIGIEGEMGADSQSGVGVNWKFDY